MSGRASVTGRKGAVRDLAWGPDGLADVHDKGPRIGKAPAANL
jgi:hypothetical protein